MYQNRDDRSHRKQRLRVGSGGYINLADDFLALAGNGRVSPGSAGVNIEMIALVSCQVFSVFRHAKLAALALMKKPCSIHQFFDYTALSLMSNSHGQPSTVSSRPTLAALRHRVARPRLKYHTNPRRVTGTSIMLQTRP